MIENYKINEELKRFEPIAKQCKYCNLREFERVDQNYYFPLYFVREKTNIIVYRSVKFNQMKVGIPRCKKCFNIHQTASFIGWLISIIITLLLGYYIYSIWDFYVLFYIVLGVPIILILGPTVVGDLIVGFKKIPTEKKAAKRDVSVKKLLESGWSTEVNF
jgi:hypothetical protein